MEDFLKELLFFSWLALLLVLETLEVEEPNDLKELILESSLNAWLGLLNVFLDYLMDGWSKINGSFEVGIKII